MVGPTCPRPENLRCRFGTGQSYYTLGKLRVAITCRLRRRSSVDQGGQAQTIISHGSPSSFSYVLRPRASDPTMGFFPRDTSTFRGRLCGVDGIKTLKTCCTVEGELYQCQILRSFLGAIPISSSIQKESFYSPIGHSMPDRLSTSKSTCAQKK